MNGNSGIVPTVDLATNNAYPYPVMYGNGFGGNNGFLGGDGWIVLLLLLAFGNGGWGNNGGFFGGGNSFDNGYAWLSNGQKEIMNNTNNGFDTLHLSNQLEGTRDAIHELSSQICNGFNNVEVSANNRQIADMNQNYNNAIANLQSFNSLQKSLDACCCENRLGIANLNSTIISENCADRQLINEVSRDIITNATSNTQSILDKLCQLELDSKTEKINDLQRELLMKDLQASQIQQTADLRFSNADAVDSLYNRLANCPVPSTPVYGRTPIFTCPNNNGCGCNSNYYGSNIM